MLQYDDAKLYVGADVTDARSRRGTTTCRSFSRSPRRARGRVATYDLALYAGKPGETEGSVRYGRHASVPGAKIVEAPTAGGYSFEAIVPWAALPEVRATRVGIHGAPRTSTATGSSRPARATRSTRARWRGCRASRSSR